MFYRLILLFVFTAQLAFSHEAILLFGPPGSGKGTFSQFAAENKGYAHFSAGDLLRDEVIRQTELGRSIEEIIKRGDYVDPDVMFQLIKNNVLIARANHQPFIIDGYARTPADIDLLRGLLQDIEVDPLVLFLEAGDAICKERILNRLVCNTCHRVYSRTMGYELGDPCPLCPDTMLEMRLNDTAAVIDKRLKQYREEVYPCYSTFLKDYPNIVYNTEHDLAISHADYEALIR